MTWLLPYLDEGFKSEAQRKVVMAQYARRARRFKNSFSGDTILVTPSAKEKGKWQATHFRRGKPTGDATFNTEKDAVASATGKMVMLANGKGRISVGTEYFKE